MYFRVCTIEQISIGGNANFERDMKFHNLQKLALTFACSVICGLLPAFAQNGYEGVATSGAADPSDSSEPTTKKMEATAYVTWWFHSALGYHPAILLRVENVSGETLNDKIRYQARFTNLRDGYVNVGRFDTFTRLEPHKQGKILLRSSRPYELPIDQDAWPKMECKVMCKIGESDDSPSQTMLITKLDSLTMSAEEASSLLDKQPDIRLRQRRAAQAATAPVTPEKTLVATTGSLAAVKDTKPKQTMGQFLTSTVVPGLGDDFYSFEKKFGIPAEFDSNKSDWTWARYQNQAPEFSMIVGSRGQTGKADLIVATVPPSQIKGESQVIDLARAISGKFRGETTTAPNHSVRYLPTGRLEFGTLNAKNYRAIYFAPSAARGSGSFIVVVTRMPGNVLDILRKEAPKAKLLRFLPPVTGVEET
jgi:hypothetical protein